MSILTDLYEPGDKIYVEDHQGRVFVYIVRSDGAVQLIQDPNE